MSRPPQKRCAIYDFVLGIMEEIYDQKRASKIRNKNLPVFPSKKALIDFVLEQSDFLDSEVLSIAPEKWTGKKIVSRTTVSNAINMLIEDNLIAKGKDGYEFVPHVRKELEKHPILNIAPSITVSVGVPENLLFLTVADGFAHQLAEYLKAQFYKEDIIFLPLGQVILCVGVLPEEVLSGKKEAREDNFDLFRERIESVLHMFNMKYPEFVYEHYYEIAYSAHSNPSMRGVFKAMAQHSRNAKTAMSIIDKRTESEVYNDVLAGLEKMPDIADDVLAFDERRREVEEDKEIDGLSLEEEIDAFFDDSLDDLINPELN